MRCASRLRSGLRGFSATRDDDTTATPHCSWHRAWRPHQQVASASSRNGPPPRAALRMGTLRGTVDAETKDGARIEAGFTRLFCSVPKSVPTRSPETCRFPRHFDECGFAKTVAFGTTKSRSSKCRLHVYLPS